MHLRWTYVKALWRAVNSICGSTIKFKTTLKGASMLMNSALRDLWMPGFCFFLMLASIITGFVKLAQGPTLASPLIISILWAFVAAGALMFTPAVNTHPTRQWLTHSCNLDLIESDWQHSSQRVLFADESIMSLSLKSQ